MKIVIVGAGAMGCLFGARLASAGEAVTLVDVDEARLALLRARGLTLVDDNGAHSRAIEARLASEVEGAFDLVMLFTKGMHTASAVKSVSHLAGPETFALTLQNGIGNAEVIAEAFTPARTLMGVTDFPADLQDSVTVLSHGVGHVWIGAFDQAGTPSLAQTVEAFNAAGLNAAASADVRVEIWEKLAFNVALNTLATITESPVGGLDSAAGRQIIATVVGEMTAVAQAKSIAISPASIHAKIANALAGHRNHKPSMLQDLLAGRTTEIETIAGTVVREGAKIGVETPVIATLANLVRMKEGAK